jgi:hypothetical protein
MPARLRRTFLHHRDKAHSDHEQSDSRRMRKLMRSANEGRGVSGENGSYYGSGNSDQQIVSGRGVRQAGQPPGESKEKAASDEHPQQGAHDLHF